MDIVQGVNVLACGGRRYTYYRVVYDALKGERERIRCVIQGGAAGADSHAKNASILLRIPYLQFDAEWVVYGRRAGTLRNERMLEEGLRLPSTLEVWAFREDLWWRREGEGNGTLDMVSRALRAGVQCRWYSKTLEWKRLLLQDEEVVAV